MSDKKILEALEEVLETLEDRETRAMNKIFCTDNEILRTYSKGHRDGFTDAIIEIKIKIDQYEKTNS